MIFKETDTVELKEKIIPDLPKEIVAFAKTEDIDASMLTDIISEYEFSGTMDAGNIRDRIEKPLPLLKKRSLVNRIVDFIRQHTEKYQ